MAILEKNPTSGEYIVKPDDNLSKIASSQGRTLAELLAQNPQYASNPNLIHPGDVVKFGAAAQPSYSGLQSTGTPPPAPMSLNEILTSMFKSAQKQYMGNQAALLGGQEAIQKASADTYSQDLANANITNEARLRLLSQADDLQAPALRSIASQQAMSESRFSSINELIRQTQGAYDKEQDRIARAKSELADAEYRSATLAEQIRSNKASEGIARDKASQVSSPYNFDADNLSNADRELSGSILGATGLSQNAFLALTGQLSKLPRDRDTRTRANMEMQEWAIRNGIDTSIFQAEYQAQTDIVQQYTKRAAAVDLRGEDIMLSLDMLKGITEEGQFKNLKIRNVAKLWAGKQVNDSLAQQYAYNLEDLRSAVAGFFAVQEGRNMTTVEDGQNAEKLIANGLATGSIDGLIKTIKTVKKRTTAISNQAAVNAQRSIWEMFGVGEQYSSVYGLVDKQEETKTWNGKLFKLINDMWVEQ